MAYTRKADLPPEYRMALECAHDSPEAELAWIEHVFACANTTCRGCRLPLDVSGAPEVALCGGCLELDLDGESPH